MKKISYTKPNGSEIVINDTPENKAFAKANGWKETNRIKKPEPELPKIDTTVQ